MKRCLSACVAVRRCAGSCCNSSSRSSHAAGGARSLASAIRLRTNSSERILRAASSISSRSTPVAPSPATTARSRVPKSTARRSRFSSTRFSPVSSLKKMAPTDHMSAAWPYRSLRGCCPSGCGCGNVSGALCSSVPAMLMEPPPGEGRASTQGPSERPKSISLSDDSGSAEPKQKLSGFRSRWARPCAWQHSTPRSTCRNTTAASSGARQPPLSSRRCSSEPPRQYSSTM
mmetsp:Transcript_58387/g.173547  ORF Transcript_58387/g.173547 Transcript_58387/m.173547 type:complete len:231 (+) Transcript_58387:1108-1800(+)